MNGLFVKGQTPGMEQYPYSLWSCLGPGEEMVSLKKKGCMERATIQDPDLQEICGSPTQREHGMGTQNSLSSLPSSSLLLMLLFISPN